MDSPYHGPDDPLVPTTDADVATVGRWHVAAAHRRRQQEANAQRDADELTRRVERLMDAEAQGADPISAREARLLAAASIALEHHLSVEEHARLIGLVGLVGEPQLRRFAAEYRDGDQLLVYVQRGHTPRLLRIGPTREHQVVPDNYLTSAPWRRSAWRIAGTFEIAALAERYGVAPAVAEVA